MGGRVVKKVRSQLSPNKSRFSAVTRGHEGRGQDTDCVGKPRGLVRSPDLTRARFGSLAPWAYPKGILTAPLVGAVGGSRQPEAYERKHAPKGQPYTRETSFP